MKTIRNIALFLLTVTLLGGCASNVSVNQYNSKPLSVGIPAGVTQQQVAEAMVQTFNGRNWNVTATTRTSATGQLSHKNYTVQAKMENLGNTVVIYTLSAEKTTTVDGQPVAVQDVPVEWIQNLQRDLSSKLQVYVQPTSAAAK